MSQNRPCTIVKQTDKKQNHPCFTWLVKTNDTKGYSINVHGSVWHRRISGDRCWMGIVFVGTSTCWVRDQHEHQVAVPPLKLSPVRLCLVLRVLERSIPSRDLDHQLYVRSLRDVMIPNLLDKKNGSRSKARIGSTVVESIPNGGIFALVNHFCNIFVPFCHEKCLLKPRNYHIWIGSTTGANSKVDPMPQKSLKIRFLSPIRIRGWNHNTSKFSSSHLVVLSSLLPISQLLPVASRCRLMTDSCHIFSFVCKSSPLT